MTKTALPFPALLAFLALSGLSLPAATLAQGYDTPEDYRPIERRISAELTGCVDKGEGVYEMVLACGKAVFEECRMASPQGPDTTATLAICGGLSASLLDREINRAWSTIKRHAGAERFVEILADQRQWLKFRDTETEAAHSRYAGGSMSAYSGWIRYNELTADRLARLHEIGAGLR